VTDRNDIIAAARKVLVGSSPLGREDTHLLDHALRMLRLSDVIVTFDDVRVLRVDRLCLDAGILFHEAAQVRLDRERRESPIYAAATMSTDEIHGYSAELAGDALGELLTHKQIDRTQEIIRQHQSRATLLPEAMIVSDAANLDDLGAIGMWRETRRFALEGRSVTDVLSSWQRKLEYGYYAARLDETFRFESSRRWARARLARLETFMSEMIKENLAEDDRDQ
jgi:HD superfamily phosphodiesterase